MDLQQAKAELERALKARYYWNKKVAQLKDVIAALGGDPDEYKTQLSFRNESIYTARLDGFSYQEISALVGLSISRVREICQQQRLKAYVALKTLFGDHG
ncbi:MAG: hypothetical protein DI535_04895 [Citrobacter freundii]|nr:MAG: hypothetical protein DI535_04895 [Citrobacter freundii]